MEVFRQPSQKRLYRHGDAEAQGREASSIIAIRAALKIAGVAEVETDSQLAAR